MESQKAYVKRMKGKRLNYSLAEMYVGFIPYSVKLVNGKVNSYGRDSGATQTRQPTPVIVPVVR